MRVAILGGGGVGVCTALEIARHGHFVDVYERDAEPVMRASRVNEGKIHQGFLYAKDASERTSRLMAKGALSFAECLRRWIDFDGDSFVLSTPFVYAVHRDSLVEVDRLRAHYAYCCDVFRGLREKSGLRYIDRDEPASFREFGQDEIESILAPEHFKAAFTTSERSVDPRPLAKRLRQAVLAEPRISFIAGAEVEAVRPRGDGAYTVVFSSGGRQQAGPYDQVVNALWDGRLAVDKSMGVFPGQDWMYRHKFGNRVAFPLAEGDLPSVTMVLGPFGDVVNFGPNGFYLSWYPIGMVAASTDLRPPADWDPLDPSFRREIFERSLREWRGFCPPLRELTFRADQVEPSSGVIFAWGATDIDDPQSHLHDRYEIGVQSVDGYHSVNTGKYTMVPYLALKTAERVLGIEVSSLDLD